MWEDKETAGRGQKRTRRKAGKGKAGEGSTGQGVNVGKGSVAEWICDGTAQMRVKDKGKRQKEREG